MRFSVLWLLLYVSFTPVLGQQSTQYSAQSGYSLVYKLSTEEAKTIALSGTASLTQFDFFSRVPYDTLHNEDDRSYGNKPGFYLRIRAVKQRLSASLELVQNLEIKKIPDRKHLRFIILEDGIREVKPEEVSINGRPVTYNETLKAYRTKPRKGGSTVVVTHNGEKAIFPINKNYNPLFYRFGDKILQSFPVKLIYKPGRDIYQSIAYGEPTGVVRKAGSLFFRELRYTWAYGYLLLNKPKYKPGDTLRYKLKLAKQNGRPYNRKVTLSLGRYGRSKFKREVRLRQGQTEGEVILHDSLNLTLDGYQELAVKRHNNHLISTSFDFEDYTLKSETYELSLARERHGLTGGNTITLSGKDENDNRLKNSRYEVEVTVVSIDKNSASGSMYIPHVLFEKQGQLDPDKDTEIVLADSLFPKINMIYKVKTAFINAANDRIEQTETAAYNFNRAELEAEVVRDSVIFSFPEDYKGTERISIKAESTFGEVTLATNVETPIRLPLNPSFSIYRAFSQDSILLKYVTMSSMESGVNHRHERSEDSLKINISNDHSLPMWYTVYREKRKIREGYTEAPLSLALRSKNKDSYLMSYGYLWAGNISNRDFEMDIYDRVLNIAVDQQSLVIPGVTDSVRIRVTNYKGKPVANVDVASVAITGKFKEDNIPNVPYFGLAGQLRANNKNFNIPYQNNRKVSLNYNQWEKPFRLDTVLYYRLTHPQGLEVTYLNTEDGQTQFAVLSIDKGSVNGISYIKLDGDLVYTYLQDQRQPFSFAASEGLHNVEVRTSTELLKIDSIYFQGGKKTIITIADGIVDKRLTRQDSAQNGRWPLNQAEKDEMTAHTLHVQLPRAQAFSVVQNGRQHDYTLSYRNNARLGPFRHDSLSVITRDKVYQILFEPGYVYEFTDNQVFKKQGSGSGFSFHWIDATRLFDFLPSETSLEKKQTQQTRRLFPRSQLDLASLNALPNSGVLTINPPIERQHYLTHAYVLSDTSSSFPIELDANQTAVLDSGHYDVFLLYRDSSFIGERVYVKTKGITIVTPKTENKRPTDRLPSLLRDPAEKERERINSQAITIPKPSAGLSGFVSGVVTGADDGLPLPQVTVLLKGTTIGTPTDMDGFFRLPTSDRGGTLVFRYLGYVTQEIELDVQSIINVQLSPGVQYLREVVVTGYGVSSSVRSVSNASAVLTGRILGVSVESASGPGAAFQIRGLGSTESSTPLYIVDGVPVASLDDISKESINDISVLKSASATAIYGARGANGVVLVTTKGPGQQSSVDNSYLNIAQGASANSIRNNFRDYAWWVPSVRTDRNGEATLVIQYPDDITSWKNHFLAMSNRGFTGQLKTTTKAFKPLASRLMIPRFLIEGDSTQVYGQISNYTGDSVEVSRSFEIADKRYDLGSKTLTQGHIDSLQVTTSHKDSLEVTYRFTARSGNDGEQRSLPVLPQGMKQVSGRFYHLEKDTSFRIIPDKNYSKPTVTIAAGFRELMLKDIEQLQQYAYWCNEQKASKLIALLAEKQLLSKSGKRFRKNSQVSSLLKRIRKGRNDDGGWGWWNNMESAPWVTNHLTRALLMAQLQGYDTKTDLEKSSQSLLDQLALLRGAELIETMHVLLDIDSTLDLKSYLPVARAQKSLSVTQEIELLRLNYRINQSFSADSLSDYRRVSQKAGVYYLDSKADFRSNSILATLSAYRLLKASGQNEAELAEIRKYLMLNRKSGAFRNTYEAAKIIHTIGADLDTTALVPDIRINGRAVSTFPYKVTMPDRAPLDIQLGSATATYLTLSQHFKNPAPAISDSLARISTYFENEEGELQEALVKGQRITLKVQVEIAERQNFAMLEVPIPAGSNYYEKPQPYDGGQYREYFKDRVNFYFESLAAGKYEFEIPLVSQFAGRYTLNPASLSLMYFPLKNANNALKKIEIR
ncbi:MAG: hypothetical protein Roseis3KO_03150 [Roseivirga sp.]